ncbi:DUF3859 domain-containing protein [Pseudoponticoccus marisrubri]|uniref:DUF3859 domain-containing protein n=1 Tax=Pseudoponticoccus marisrubri TaxID=1685382 RepID=A0A0W7WHV1_9RHOB|nr:DUF3859 domain-containing protein [Pseudoponticoccus marisrubri]KUF10095.1 hypothetical protein AVJ23_13655 [Pseudoponticoccus marisrubri]
MIRCSLAALCLAGTAQAEGASFAEPPMILLDHGVICEIELDGHREAPGTESGRLNIVDQDQALDLTTAAVPAQIGLSFGIRATLEDGVDPGDVEVVVTHPPMGPRNITEERWDAEMTPGDIALNLFTFEYDYELVQGPWSFQLRRDDRTLLRQDFVVGPRDSVPVVQDTCFTALIMS